MEIYLPTLMYIISGIMLTYTVLSIKDLSQHIKNQAKDIEKRFDYKNEGKQSEKQYNTNRHHVGTPSWDSSSHHR